MKRTLTALAISLVLATLMPAASVTASHAGVCGSAGLDPFITGEAKTPTVQLRRHKAQLRWLGLPELCTPAGPDDDSLTGAWIGIEPTSKTYGGEIIQMGTAICADNTNPYPFTTDDICDPANSGSVRFFAAWDPGCNIFEGPIPMDLGPGDYNTHWFEINLGNTNVEFLIDGVRRGLIPNDTAHGCWLNDFRRDIYYTVACESWDPGDSCGGFAAAHLKVDGIAWMRHDTGAWVAAGYSDPCSRVGHSRHRCDVIDGNTVDVWSVQ